MNIFVLILTDACLNTMIYYDNADGRIMRIEKIYKRC